MSARRLPALVLVAAAALLALPAAAGAHSIVRVSSGVITYISSDAISLNELDVGLAGTNIRLADPAVDGGIDYGPCTPGATNSKGEVTEVFCGRTGINQVRVELGEREDVMKIALSLPVPVLALGGGGRDTLQSAGQPDILVGNEGDDVIDGGDGNDQMNGSEGADTLRGGRGDDVIQAGPGADPEVSGAEGNDDIRVRDGAADRVTCGPGIDKVDADTADQIAADCENVVRATPPPSSGGGGSGGGGGSDGGGGTGGDGSGGGGTDGGGGAGGGPGTPAAEDRTAPKLRVGASTSQRLRGSGVVRVLATSSERGTVAASGFVEIAGARLPLKSKVARIATAGGGAAVTVKLSKGQLRQARRSLRRGRRVRVALGVVATDEAGNSTTRKAPTVRLRR